MKPKVHGLNRTGLGLPRSHIERKPDIPHSKPGSYRVTLLQSSITGMPTQKHSYDRSLATRGEMGQKLKSLRITYEANHHH